MRDFTLIYFFTSNTKYISFHDSDDISSSRRIEKQINFIEKNNYLACSCLGYYKNITKMPMISLTFKKIVLEKLGFFYVYRFGSDEDYYYRFFANFDTSFDWNSSTLYNPQIKSGFYGDYKNFGIITEVLYNIYQQSKSLTVIYNSIKML